MRRDIEALSNSRVQRVILRYGVRRIGRLSRKVRLRNSKIYLRQRSQMTHCFFSPSNVSMIIFALSSSFLSPSAAESPPMSLLPPPPPSSASSPVPYDPDSSNHPISLYCHNPNFTLAFGLLFKYSLLMISTTEMRRGIVVDATLAAER